MESSVDMIRELVGGSQLHGDSINDRIVAADDALKNNDMQSFYAQASKLMEDHGFNPRDMDKEEFMTHYHVLVEEYFPGL
tara:strand:+ start:113 stop:352 length:240 start_codon:yes stop_codon:yes gene_type:complete